MLSKEMLELYEAAVSTVLIKEDGDHYVIIHPDKGFLCVDEDGVMKVMAFETILEAEFHCMSLLMGELVSPEEEEHTQH